MRNKEMIRMDPTKVGRKMDRRTRYTRQTIRDTLLERMKEKPFGRVTVTEVCKQAEINRGTFYLHYLDLDDVLDDILTEMLDATTCALDHVLCPERQCTTYPFCDKIHSSEQYRVLFLDESVTDKLLAKLSDTCKERYVTYLMSHSLLTFQEAEAIFTFQMNGCLAINRLMLRNHCTDWKCVQRSVDGFIKAGLEHYLLPDREGGSGKGDRADGR